MPESKHFTCEASVRQVWSKHLASVTCLDFEILKDPAWKTNSSPRCCIALRRTERVRDPSLLSLSLPSTVRSTVRTSHVAPTQAFCSGRGSQQESQQALNSPGPVRCSFRVKCNIIWPYLILSKDFHWLSNSSYIFLSFEFQKNVKQRSVAQVKVVWGPGCRIGSRTRRLRQDAVVRWSQWQALERASSLCHHFALLICQISGCRNQKMQK